MIIRPARIDDAAGLEALAAAMDVDTRGQPFVEQLADERVAVFVAESGALVVGFLALRTGPSPTRISSQSPLQLWRLYVHPEEQGRGTARLLMGRAMVHAHVRRHDVIWVRTPGDNARAIAFYGKCGFSLVRRHEILPSVVDSGEVVMVCIMGVD